MVTDYDEEGLRRALAWAQQDNARLREGNSSLRRWGLQQAHRVSALELEAAERDARDRADVAYLHGKVRRQAKRLRALEENHAARQAEARQRVDAQKIGMVD